ncbi:glycosyltransferase family 4 protein [Synechococcus sp. N19]|uniref:glycosyltransferase family 4 protein n=1 Tax=Synechococcus sp. N19 TaxID=2575512 RepID=UPI000E0E260D|nr:glycosyltransferase family 4 protein [Synechococcus sp. N19]
MVLQSLPVLITSGDLLPGGGELNGRRWAGQQLLRCWARQAGSRPMALAHAVPAQLEQLKPWLKCQGFTGELHPLGLLDPEPCRAWGGFFLPDPSIGRWAQWRQPVGSAAFSLIGQIHTLSTPAALGHLQDLVTEPVQPWDALICSSRAGRDAVEQVLDAREEQLQWRTGASPALLRSQRPHLPVIPLPLPPESLEPFKFSKLQARKSLGIAPGHPVVLWLGRLSLLTKTDPWPTYLVLERVARELRRPVVFIECGPDDKPSPHEDLENLRRLCPSVRFLRLGGAEPVSEEVKRQALAAADVAVSLVDNAQETFGLAVAEAMAAGLPLVASDWSGYRDLVRDGVDGFLIPSAWATSASRVSVPLGWQQFTGIQGFPAVAGALAQLVQLDLLKAEMALLTVLSQPSMARAMGAAAARRARELFAPELVMAAHEKLFAELEQRRCQAPPDAHCPRPVSPQLDPVRVFARFASHTSESIPARSETLQCLPPAVRQQRALIWQILAESLPNSERGQMESDLVCKHQQLDCVEQVATP